MQDIIPILVGLITISTSLIIGVRWLVKHYLIELKPNGGESLKDKVCDLKNQFDRLETKVDNLYLIILDLQKSKRSRQKSTEVLQ
jgi:hypothetical protein